MLSRARAVLLGIIRWVRHNAALAVVTVNAVVIVGVLGVGHLVGVA